MSMPPQPPPNNGGDNRNPGGPPGGHQQLVQEWAVKRMQLVNAMLSNNPAHLAGLGGGIGIPQASLLQMNNLQSAMAGPMSARDAVNQQYAYLRDRQLAPSLNLPPQQLNNIAMPPNQLSAADIFRRSIQQQAAQSVQHAMTFQGQPAPMPPVSQPVPSINQPASAPINYHALARARAPQAQAPPVALARARAPQAQTPPVAAAPAAAAHHIQQEPGPEEGRNNAAQPGGKSLQDSIQKRINQKIQEKLKKLQPDQAAAMASLLQLQRGSQQQITAPQDNQLQRGPEPQRATQQAVNQRPHQGIMGDLSVAGRMKNDDNEGVSSQQPAGTLTNRDSATDSQISGLRLSSEQGQLSTAPLVAVEASLAQSHHGAATLQSATAIKQHPVKQRAATTKKIAQSTKKEAAQAKKVTAKATDGAVGESGKAPRRASQPPLKKRKVAPPKTSPKTSKAPSKATAKKGTVDPTTKDTLNELDEAIDSMVDKNIRSALQEDREHLREEHKEMQSVWQDNIMDMESRLRMYTELEVLAEQIAEIRSEGSGKSSRGSCTKQSNIEGALDMIHLRLKDYRMLEDTCDRLFGIDEKKMNEG